MTRNTSLFKFRAFNKASIELLLNKELWFAKPSSLNDPFECQFHPDTIFSGLENHSLLNLDKHKKTALDVFNSLGICSFSRTRKNQLMWSHYADEHKGFCIGFNEGKLLKSENGIKPLNVKYQSKLPLEPLVKIFNQTSENNFQGTLSSKVFHEAVSTKYTYWKYERERRLISVESKPFSFKPESIVSIAFGLRMTERDKATLKRMLSYDEWKHLKWYQAEKSKDKFALEFKRI